LHSAVGCVQTAAVRWLLDHGAPVNGTDSRMLTPLHVAAVRPCEEIIQMLAQRGAMLAAEDDTKKTPLQVAAALGECQGVRLLLKAGASDVKLDCSALMMAIIEGDRRIVDLFGPEEWKEVVGVTDGLGRDALTWAAMIDDATLVQKLLGAGFDPLRTDKGGKSSIEWAIKKGCTNTVRVILEHMTRAVQTQVPWQAEPVLRKPAQNWKPLIAIAATCEQCDVIDMLVEFGGDDVRRIIRHGDLLPGGGGFMRPTVLQPPMVRKLISLGAAVNAASTVTPLKEACICGEAESVEALLEAGARPEQPVYGMSDPAPALAIVCRSEVHGRYPEWKLTIAKLLIAAKADVNAADDAGRTPLHGAALAAHAEMVRTLLEAGARVDVRDKKGRLPIDIIGTGEGDDEPDEVRRLLADAMETRLR
jgi:ankyrin repeat protein